MKITTLKYGESQFWENYIFNGGSESRSLPISFVIYLSGMRWLCKKLTTDIQNSRQPQCGRLLF